MNWYKKNQEPVPELIALNSPAKGAQYTRSYTGLCITVWITTVFDIEKLIY